MYFISAIPFVNMTSACMCRQELNTVIVNEPSQDNLHDDSNRLHTFITTTYFSAKLNSLKPVKALILIFIIKCMNSNEK